MKRKNGKKELMKKNVDTKQNKVAKNSVEEKPMDRKSEDNYVNKSVYEIPNEPYSNRNEETLKQIADDKPGNIELLGTNTKVENGFGRNIDDIEVAKDHINAAIGVDDFQEILKIQDNKNDERIKKYTEKVLNSVDNTYNAVKKNQKVSYDIVSEVGKTANEIQETLKEQASKNDEKTNNILSSIDKTIGYKIQKASEDVIRSVNDTRKNISNTQDKLISKVNVVYRRVDETGQSIESIEGRLGQLDEIIKLLSNKGLNISMEIPPVNTEEEDIINLVRYSQKITEHLGYAARDLIRKQETFRKQSESNANEQKIMEQKIAHARKEGAAEGRKQVVKMLLSKYQDIDTIKDSQENYVHVIWTLLTELGIVIDGNGRYEKGREVELSEEDIEKMMAIYSKLEGAGKYRVVKTGLSLLGEVISAAQFEKVAEDTSAASREDTTSGESASEENSTDEQENTEETVEML